jgi:hypothetical protein
MILKIRSTGTYVSNTLFARLLATKKTDKQSNSLPYFLCNLISLDANFLWAIVVSFLFMTVDSTSLGTFIHCFDTMWYVCLKHFPCSSI